MRIFLDEPLIDWQKNAHMQTKSTKGTIGGAGGDSTQASQQQQAPMDAAGFARMQMRVADLKLGKSSTATALKATLTEFDMLNCARQLRTIH
jgi:hypothetical protein